MYKTKNGTTENMDQTTHMFSESNAHDEHIKRNVHDSMAHYFWVKKIPDT